MLITHSYQTHFDVLQVQNHVVYTVESSTLIKHTCALKQKVVAYMLYILWRPFLVSLKYGSTRII